MTPLLASTSVWVTATSLPAASVSETAPSSATFTVNDLAVDGGDLLAGEAGDVGGHDLALDHVVGEDVGEVTGGVGQQGVDGAGGQGLEGGVGGGEHGEGPLAPQGLLQAGGLDGGDQRVEVAGGHGGVDDVGLGRLIVHLGGGFIGGAGLFGGVGRRRSSSSSLHAPTSRVKAMAAADRRAVVVFFIRGSSGVDVIEPLFAGCGRRGCSRQRNHPLHPNHLQVTNPGVTTEST